MRYAPDQMRIFVTGGSGFVGGHVIETLAKSHEMLAMARSDASARVVEGLGARAVRTSLDDITPAHLGGVDAVVHSAAYVKEWGTRAQFWEANVTGTERMLAAAREAGVKRFLHVGTEAALFDGHDLVDIDETRSYPPRQLYLYPETKAEAERRVLAANAPSFVTISIRPRFVWGPRDATILPVVVELAKAGRFAWIDGGRQQTSTCHVANLVRAIELALTRGRGGESYFVTDDGKRTMHEMLTALAATQGVALPERSLPGWLARFLAAVVEGTWKGLHLSGTPPLTRFPVTMTSRTITLCTDKAERELGYEPVIDVARGIEELRAAAREDGRAA